MIQTGQTLKKWSTVTTLRPTCRPYTSNYYAQRQQQMRLDSDSGAANEAHHTHRDKDCLRCRLIATPANRRPVTYLQLA
ncbi:hypothetical protein EVAR_66207_1 [Eumeta japonica]|uniref:Uncharacterized protein n=1 Tax=Eumeta variegata TaxID=151549 RepID=A0A4C1ZHL5_EUMVA|nr:hypothetical protein EVAR_66207_1 [Eumeta japonica]